MGKTTSGARKSSDAERAIPSPTDESWTTSVRCVACGRDVSVDVPSMGEHRGSCTCGKFELNVIYQASRRRGQKVHRLKTWPEPFEAVERGDKHHEVRVDDRDYQVGDVLVLTRWDPKTRSYGKARRTQRVIVTHKTQGGSFGLPKEICVLSIAHLDETSGRRCCSASHQGFANGLRPFRAMR